MRKALGLIFVTIGSVLGLAFIVSIPNLMITTMDIFSSGAYSIGAWAGTITYLMLHCTLTYFLFKFGIKWLQNPKGPQLTETLDAGLIDASKEKADQKQNY